MSCNILREVIVKINGAKMFFILGCIALSPFILRDLIIVGIKWIYKKIKK